MKNQFNRKSNKKTHLLDKPSYDLHIHFSHPDIPPYDIQGITLPITQNTINDIYDLLQNQLENNLNQSIIFLKDTLPSPTTNNKLTPLELEHLIISKDIYYISTIPITILDPDKPPFYIAIPNNTLDLPMDITRLIQTYINRLYNKNIFTINNTLPSPITGDSLTPQDLRELVYYHEPLLITFITTPSEERVLTIQQSSLDRLRNHVQHIQQEIIRYNKLLKASMNPPIYMPEEFAEQRFQELQETIKESIRDMKLYNQAIIERDQHDTQGD